MPAITPARPCHDEPSPVRAGDGARRPVSACPRWSIAFILLGLSLQAQAAGTGGVGACGVRSGEVRVPVVELYTSEGCSSCPPADRWLTRQVAAGGHDVHWLAFHVDYWDDLGWPDRFGAAAHSERQRQRVAAAGRRTVYTPQVMVGSEVFAMWRTDRPFRRQLDAERGPAQAGLALRLQTDGGGARLHVGAALTSTGAATDFPSVWVAETRDARFTEVRAGENAGTRLRHDRVVVALWGPWPLEGGRFARTVTTTAGEIPDAAWTAFVQTADGRILQSLRLEGGDCR